MSLRTKFQLGRLLLTGPAAPRRHAAQVLWMWVRGVDLRGVLTEDLGLDDRRSVMYWNSGGADLDAVFQTFDIAPHDSVMDLGCGKGGALITLARYPFAHVDGVEISAQLVEIARRNLSRLQINKPRIFCSDAENFTDLDPYTYLYLYHPFREPVMKRVLENIGESLRRKPRRLTLVYKNPVCELLVLAADFSPIRDFHHSTDLFRIYSRG